MKKIVALKNEKANLQKVIRVILDKNNINGSDGVCLIYTRLPLVGIPEPRKVSVTDVFPTLAGLVEQHYIDMNGYWFTNNRQRVYAIFNAMQIIDIKVKCSRFPFGKLIANYFIKRIVADYRNTCLLRNWRLSCPYQ